MTWVDSIGPTLIFIKVFFCHLLLENIHYLNLIDLFKLKNYLGLMYKAMPTYMYDFGYMFLQQRYDT